MDLIKDSEIKQIWIYSQCMSIKRSMIFNVKIVLSRKRTMAAEVCEESYSENDDKKRAIDVKNNPIV